MRLRWRIKTPLVTKADERFVEFWIEGVSPDDATLLARYGRPKIQFYPGNDMANEFLWACASAGVEDVKHQAQFPSPAAAQAHVDNVCDAFKREIGYRRTRLEHDGFTSSEGFVDA